jgi:hypothetical protein
METALVNPAQTDAALVSEINHETQFHPGEMPIGEQTSTFHVFDNLVRFGSLGVACAILFLTLMFCTPAGFAGAAIPTVIVAVGGFFLLRRAPTSLETH